MLSKLLKFLVGAAIEAHGAVCPKCGSTDTDKENGIWYCHRCDHEWGG
jgi:ribosomal protein L37AE/L43A